MTPAIQPSLKQPASAAHRGRSLQRSAVSARQSLQRSDDSGQQCLLRSAMRHQSL